MANNFSPNIFQSGFNLDVQRHNGLFAEPHTRWWHAWHIFEECHNILHIITLCGRLQSLGLQVTDKPKNLKNKWMKIFFFSPLILIHTLLHIRFTYSRTLECCLRYRRSTVGTFGRHIKCRKFKICMVLCFAFSMHFRGGLVPSTCAWNSLTSFTEEKKTGLAC